MDRQPLVAGQFYPGDEHSLKKMVREYLKEEPQSEKHSLLCMAPHAGYVYSGRMAGAAIGRAKLADTIILLGPNHSGRGESLAVWPSGEWKFPGGELPVDTEFTQALLKQDDRFLPDTVAHTREHSLEVMIPFLWLKNPQSSIVPICVSENSLEDLRAAGNSLAHAVKGHSETVSILVSSDMSHYISHDKAKERDKTAIEKILALDPEGLYETVLRNNITMCGVFPMTLGLFAAKELGAQDAELVGYTTSAEVSGDYSQVVGYAGIIAF